MRRENPPILVHNHQIKPPLLIPRHEHPNSITPQLEVHPLVLDIAHAVQAQARAPLAEEDGPHHDARGGGVRVVHGQVEFAHVVDEAGDGEDVEGGEGAVLCKGGGVSGVGWGDGDKGGGLTAPAPCGSSWFPCIENTGIPTLRFGSS